jgi:DNA-binding beta-propeller fold protein YncE
MGDNLVRRASLSVMKTPMTIRCSLALGCLFLTLTSIQAGAPLTAGEPVVLGKTQGRFDFLRVDPARHRLLLAHTGNKSLDVVDLDTKRLVKSVSTGAAQDSAVDAKNGRYYVSVSSPPRMAIVDATTLEMTGEVPLRGPADLLMFNPENNRVYVCNDEVPELYVIDPAEKKIEATITFSGKGMEDLALDEQHRHLFQAIKDANALSVVDVSNNKILETWPTAPAASPHGMALIPNSDYLLVAGGNGKLVLMSRSTGKVLAQADIAPRVDEMAYDPALHRAYCASGQGKISVVSVEGTNLAGIGDVPDATGCHSIVLDPKTHTVWIAYAKEDQSFAQPFEPAK